LETFLTKNENNEYCVITTDYSQKKLEELLKKMKKNADFELEEISDIVENLGYTVVIDAAIRLKN
jgi:hypothetical protein